jgi:hypothetical protein
MVAGVFQITFYTKMHANDVFLFFKNYFWHQHIKTIQNIQIILNFNKKKIQNIWERSRSRVPIRSPVLFNLPFSLFKIPGVAKKLVSLQMPLMEWWCWEEQNCKVVWILEVEWLPAQIQGRILWSSYFFRRTLHGLASCNNSTVSGHNPCS